MDKFTECLAKIDLICGFRLDETIEEIWTRVYPDDPMNFEDFGFFLWESSKESLDFDPFVPDDVESVLHDVEKLGYIKFSKEVRNLLANS